MPYSPAVSYGSSPLREKLYLHYIPGDPIPAGTMTVQIDGQTVWTGPWVAHPSSSYEDGVPPLPASSVGTHSLTVSWPGDANYNPKTMTIAFTVTRAKPFIFSLIPTYQQPSLTVTALHVETYSGGSSSGPVVGARGPTGFVTFRVDGIVIYRTQLNVTTIANAFGKPGNTIPMGVANLPIDRLHSGILIVEAVYEGDSNYETVSEKGTVGIAPVPTITKFIASTPNATYGSPVLLAIGVYWFEGQFLPVAGLLNINENGKAIASHTFNYNELRTVTVPFLKIGTHTLVAQFAGAQLFLPSQSDPFTVVINPISTGLTITCPSNAYPGQSVTCNARVDYVIFGPTMAGKPTGTVKLTAAGATGTLGADPKVSINITLPVTTGPASIVGTYSGDDGFATSTSAPAIINIAKASASIAVAVDPRTGTEGNPIPVLVSVKSSVSAPANGTVTLTERGATLATGTMGTDGTGTIIIPQLTKGSHSITAVYAGNNIHNGSTSEALTFEVKAAPALAVVSAAGGAPAVAPDSLVTIYGSGLSTTTASAASSSLPVELAGVRIDINNASGQTSPARLQYVSPSQINFLMPADVAPGNARLTVIQESTKLTGDAVVAAFAPGLFTADGTPGGPAAGYLVIAREDGSTDQKMLFDCASGVCRTAPVAIDGTSVLVLYGTGIRSATRGTVRVLIGQRSLEPLYAGAQVEFAGLDQVNVALPEDLAGTGDTTVSITNGSRQSNAVRVHIQ